MSNENVMEVVAEVKAAIEKLRTEKIEKHGEDLGELKKNLRDLETKAGRPGAPLAGETAANIKAAFERFARTGEFERKAMSIGSSPDGGYEVPTELDTELQRVASNVSPILQVCKCVNGATDAYVQNIVTGVPASGWVAESGNRAATATPTITQITFNRGGVYANASATNWMLQDGAHDVGQWLTDEIGRAFGSAIATALSSGDGVNKPKGITQYVHAAVPTFGQVKQVGGGQAAAVTLDGCLNALMALHPEYQDDAVFIMSTTAAAMLRAQKASTAGSFMWSPDAKEGVPPSLFGKRVLIDPTLPAVVAGSKSVYVASWRRAYTCVNYGSPFIVRDAVTAKGNTLFYLERRVGGALTDSNAIACHVTQA
jgi:HK97 family phage major capsid protein